MRAGIKRGDLDPGSKAQRVLDLLAQGVAKREIVALVGCHRTYVRTVAQRHAAALRAALAVAAPAPDAAPVDGADVLATGGKWAALRAFAELRGITVIKAQQLWHSARRARRGAV